MYILNKYVKNPKDIIVTTHVTSPFLKLKTIIKASKRLKKYDSVASVTKDYNFAWIENKKKFTSEIFDIISEVQ